MSLTSHIVRTLFTIGDLKRDLGWVPPTDVEAIENVSYLQNVLKLPRGERVAIMMPNVLQYPIALFGIHSTATNR